MNQADQQQQHFQSLQLGTTYLFFTVTYFYVGTVVAITPTDVVLRDAWIAYGIPKLETLLKAAENARRGLCEEVAELGDVVLHGYASACPLPTASPPASTTRTKRG